MIAVKCPVDHAPRAQAKLRAVSSPIREEWQQDGSWTGLFDLPDEEAESFYALVDEVTDGEAQVREIESEEDIPGFRMALYLFEPTN